jgi:hypothetical protein
VAVGTYSTPFGDRNNLMDSGRARWVIADSTPKALLGVHRLEALIVSTYLAPSPSVPTCSGALARVNRTPGEARLALRIVGRLRRREDAVACADMRPW